MLEAEMDEHLGYEKNSVAGNKSENSRNGYGKKTITSDYGECEISIPRDRSGEFEPKTMAIYAKGMSRRDIEDTLREIYGSEISQGLISRITDSCGDCKEVMPIRDWGPAYAQFAIFFEDRFAA